MQPLSDLLWRQTAPRRTGTCRRTVCSSHDPPLPRTAITVSIEYATPWAVASIGGRETKAGYGWLLPAGQSAGRYREADNAAPVGHRRCCEDACLEGNHACDGYQD